MKKIFLYFACSYNLILVLLFWNATTFSKAETANGEMATPFLIFFALGIIALLPVVYLNRKTARNRINLILIFLSTPIPVFVITNLLSLLKAK